VQARFVLSLPQPFLWISKWRPACATSSGSMLIRPYTPSSRRSTKRARFRRLIANSPVAPGLRRIGILSFGRRCCVLAYGYDRSVFEPQAGVRDVWRRFWRPPRDADLLHSCCRRGDSSGTLALFRAGGAEDVGGARALIVGRSYPTSGQASNDQCGANISSLDNLGTKSPRPTISTGRMNDT
jgi:hypothetical protein